jgi:hypothetical protein
MAAHYDATTELRDHENLDYRFPWGPFPDGDATEKIATSLWIQESGPTLTLSRESISPDELSTTVYISGTRPHSRTIVANVVTTTAGRTYERRLLVVGI